ncbi:caspase family protein [Streptomyces sp. NPDC051907]|uniref:caspase family protein n=1 Tax=Streptomyces sp. NPDC051907 TaxID=3155284 RepID=UPI00342E0E7D
MGRHRALLIGASDYEMRGVAALPFVPGDLARLGSALKGSGFDEVQVLAGREGGKQVSANYVNARVAGFLRRARADDTLFILLSGHGVHAKGRDYLVPEDIDEDTHPFESGCVAIDWRAHLDDTPARHVVFLIDACREGIEQESMGVASVRQWSQQKVGAALRRKVAYVYACSPAQLALFVRPYDALVDPVTGVRPGESFSLFSRSVSDVVTARSHTAGLTLAEFKEAVQDRMTELHRAYRKRGQPQTLRIVTDIALDDFVFLPPPRRRPVQAPPPPSMAERAGTPSYESTMSIGTPVPSRPPLSSPPLTSPPASSRASRQPSQPSSPSPSSSPSSSPSGEKTVGRSNDTRSLDQLLRDLKRSKRRHNRELRRLFDPGYWTGIVLAVVMGLAFVAGIGYAIWASWPDGSQRAGEPSGPSASAQKSSRHTAAPQSQDPFPDLGKQAVNTKAVMSLPLCTAAESVAPVTLRLKSERNSYGPKDTPVLDLAIESISACRINAVPKQVVLTLMTASEEKPLWNSTSCTAKTPDRWIAVSPGTPATVVYRWDRHTSCRPTETGRLPTGSYVAASSVAAHLAYEGKTSFIVAAD